MFYRTLLTLLQQEEKLLSNVLEAQRDLQDINDSLTVHNQLVKRAEERLEECRVKIREYFTDAKVSND
jgi:DNA repair ATPase RecN